jgi:hypothetical protein
MGRALHRLATVLAGLALVAMLPAPCPCPDEPIAPPSGHECCAPPAGVSASDHGCCEGHDHAEPDVLTPGAAPLPSVAEVAVLRVPVLRLDGASRSTVVLSPPPPPAILRI